MLLQVNIGRPFCRFFALCFVLSVTGLVISSVLLWCSCRVGLRWWAWLWGVGLLIGPEPPLYLWSFYEWSLHKATSVWPLSRHLAPWLASLLVLLMDPCLLRPLNALVCLMASAFVVWSPIMPIITLWHPLPHCYHTLARISMRSCKCNHSSIIMYTHASASDII